MAATGRGKLAAWKASPNLQSVVRALLLRPVAENGSEAAARVLRELADELEGLPELCDEEGD